jgi:probable HAF family extracellular repeat protein
MRRLLTCCLVALVGAVLAVPLPAHAIPYRFTLLDVPGATDTSALGLNNRGQIVGDYSDTSGHGFLYAGGTFTALNAPGATGTIAFGINRVGQVVGVSIDLTGIHGFLYRNGHFSAVDVPGNSGGTEAFGINRRGEIVGLYFTDSGRKAHGFTDLRGNFTTIDFPGAAQTQLNGIIDQVRSLVSTSRPISRCLTDSSIRMGSFN